MMNEIRFMLNGENVLLKTNPLRRVVDVLRDDFGLTGTKEGCGEGECGACAVILDGRLVNSCLLPAAALEGGNLVTIEGFRTTKRFSVLKECFSEAGAVQCGFCTPGFLMSLVEYLGHNPNPTDEEVREAIDGNFCRCTGYVNIEEAVKLAAKKMAAH